MSSKTPSSSKTKRNSLNNFPGDSLGLFREFSSFEENSSQKAENFENRKNFESLDKWTNNLSRNKGNSVFSN